MRALKLAMSMPPETCRGTEGSRGRSGDRGRRDRDRPDRCPGLEAGSRGSAASLGASGWTAGARLHSVMLMLLISIVLSRVVGPADSPSSLTRRWHVPPYPRTSGDPGPPERLVTAVPGWVILSGWTATQCRRPPPTPGWPSSTASTASTASVRASAASGVLIPRGLVAALVVRSSGFGSRIACGMRRGEVCYALLRKSRRSRSSKRACSTPRSNAGSRP
jgi:hypothetical protein